MCLFFCRTRFSMGLHHQISNAARPINCNRLPWVLARRHGVSSKLLATGKCNSHHSTAFAFFSSNIVSMNALKSINWNLIETGNSFTPFQCHHMSCLMYWCLLRLQGGGIMHLKLRRNKLQNNEWCRMDHVHFNYRFMYCWVEKTFSSPFKSIVTYQVWWFFRG